MKKDQDKKIKETIPYMSAPVISRTGKIGRKDINEEQPKPAVRSKARKKADRVEKVDVSPESGDMTISDGAFIVSRAKKAKKNRGVHTVKSREKHPFPVVTVLGCLICTVLFMSLVFNLVRINEYTKDVADMRDEVTTLQKQKNELSAKLDSKNSVEELKAYLEAHADTMGMVEEGKMNPPVAVTPEKVEVITDYDAPEESEAVFTTVLNALAKNFIDAFSVFGAK